MKKLMKTLWQRTLIILLAVHCQLANAQQYSDYDADHPVIIVCNWDFPPYEFNNDSGRPDGFHVQLLSTIFSKLKMPFQFVMKETLQAQEAFEHREADLFIDPMYKYHGRPYVLSRNVLNYYKVRIVTAPGTPVITRLSQLTTADTLVLKEDDYSTGRIVHERQLAVPIEYHSPNEAILGLVAGRYQYFVWGQYPTEWKMRTMAIDSLTLTPIDIPDGEMRVVGYDKDLLELIDDEYARMEQSGELEVIYDTWFHPERIHNDTSPIALFVLAGIIIATIIAFLMSRLIRVRVQSAVRKSNHINRMMTEAVDMGRLKVIEFDLEAKHVRNLYGNLLPEEGVKFGDKPEYIHPDDQQQFRQCLLGMTDETTQRKQLTVRWNVGSIDSPKWVTLSGNATAESEGGRLRYLVCSLRDITKEVEETRLNQQLANKYMKVFETNLVAMSFYDGDGKLIDVNDKMRQLCNFDEAGELLFRNARLFDIPLFKGDFTPNSHEYFHACQHMHYADAGIDKYIEFRVAPTFNDQDELVYYIVTARDVTAERTMYLEQRQHDRQLQQVNQDANRYEEQLRYLLEKSDMIMWELDFTTQKASFTGPTSEEAITMDLKQFFQGVATQGDNRQNNLSELEKCISEQKPLNTLYHFDRTPITSLPGWYFASGIPTFNAEGRATSYFGIAKNITPLIKTQERLKEETERAENSGRLKSAFLANMTHEIRTPLNAIVGFSDLLPLIDAPEERMEFIRIIRNNCDMLMRLINDILEASTMGQALAIQPEEIDFAQVFEDICQTLAQRVQEPGVEFIKDNPYDSYVTTLDKGRIQQVLTNFTTNAVKYTHEGHIKVGYRQERRQTHDGLGEADGLYFYCEDTGAGIPKEKQASVFERFVKLNDFVQGTGLGLSICQNIAERCNGHIGVTSEGEGHGSTFWMWIPCEVKSEKVKSEE